MSKYSLKNLLQESPKVGDIFDAYSNRLYGMIDPVGYSRDNFEDFSSGHMHKYGSTDSAAVWLEDKENMKSLPVPIREGIEDVYGSSWVQQVSFKRAIDQFFNEYPELAQTFYGIDDVDPQMVRDAGYEEEAAYWEKVLEETKMSLIYTDFEVRFGTSIKTNFDRDPNSIYVYVYSQLYDLGDVGRDYEEPLIEVDLGKTYNNIDSPEALEAAITEFQTELVPKFMAGEKPSNTTLNEAVEVSKKPINEDLRVLSRYEGLLNDVASYPLHYVDLQDSLERDMISDILDSGINQNTDAVITYVGKTVAEHLNKLDRKAGFIDKQGRPETDEGYFTMVGSDFYEELGIFVDSNEWDIYTSEGLLDAYTLTGDQVDDVIQAGELDKLSEQEDDIEAEQDYYDPSFTLIDLEIENAVEELMPIGGVEDYGSDDDVEELASGDGSARYADGAYKGTSVSNLDLAFEYGTPTRDSDEKVRITYDQIREYAHDLAVIELGQDAEHREVWTDLSGDPDLITYGELMDIADAMEEGDPERAKKYENAAERLDGFESEYINNDEGYYLYYEVEIAHFTKDNTSNETGKPMLKFYADITDRYSKAFASKAIIKTFESEEELQKALEEGSLEIEKWFDGEETEEVKELNEGIEDDIYELIKKETQENITPGFNNPEEDFESSLYNDYSDVLVSEKYNIPFRDYIDGTFSLPKEFETNTIEELYIKFYKQAEQDVFSDIENYLPRDRSNDFTGIEDELGDMFISGDLRDIDPELYAEISNTIEEEADNYSLESGVGRSFNAFIDNDKKRIEFVASVIVDPLYKGIERTKEINLTFDQADKIPEVIQQMDDWLQGK